MRKMALVLHVGIARLAGVLTSFLPMCYLLHRYLVINAHAGSYTWKALKIPPAYKAEPGKPQTAASAVFEELDLNRTLEDNGVVDESADFEDVGLPGDYYVPVLHVYWQDDLTVA